MGPHFAAVGPNRCAAVSVLAPMLSGVGAQAALCPATEPASLPDCINGTDPIIAVTADMHLSAELPLIDRTVTIQGNDKTVSVGSLYTPFLPRRGTVAPPRSLSRKMAGPAASQTCRT